MSLPVKKEDPNTPVLRSKVNSKQAAAERQRAADKDYQEGNKFVSTLKNNKVYIAAAGGIALLAIIGGICFFKRDVLKAKFFSGTVKPV